MGASKAQHCEMGCGPRFGSPPSLNPLRLPQSPSALTPKPPLSSLVAFFPVRRQVRLVNSQVHVPDPVGIHARRSAPAHQRTPSGSLVLQVPQRPPSGPPRPLGACLFLFFPLPLECAPGPISCLGSLSASLPLLESPLLSPFPSSLPVTVTQESLWHHDTRHRPRPMPHCFP